MNNEILIFHTTPCIHPKAGGTSRAVVDLADALATQSSIQPMLISQSLVGEPTVPSANSKVQRIIADVKTSTEMKLGLPFRALLQKAIDNKENSLIHNHGLWLPVNHWASQVAHKQNVPLIIQPHGMLEPWALRQHKWKKSLALWLFQRRDLASAKLFIATAVQEAESIRKLGLRQPIAVIPNGVSITESPISVKKNKHIKTALFLSRVHPQKGLINLVRAWATIRPVAWQVVIAGPDENGHQAEVEREIQHQGLSDIFKFVGSVEDQVKEKLYSTADLFILPTYSENFGIVIAEALSREVPVITTKGAPWAELEKYKCGWWIDIGVKSLAKALKEAVNLLPAERLAMGQRGRRLVEQNYSWQKIGQEMLSVYEWALGGENLPSCIITD